MPDHLMISYVEIDPRLGHLTLPELRRARARAHRRRHWFWRGRPW